MKSFLVRSIQVKSIHQLNLTNCTFFNGENFKKITGPHFFSIFSSPDDFPLVGVQESRQECLQRTSLVLVFVCRENARRSAVSLFPDCRRFCRCWIKVSATIGDDKNKEAEKCPPFLIFEVLRGLVPIKRSQMPGLRVKIDPMPLSPTPTRQPTFMFSCICRSSTIVEI